ncbi:NADP-dependent malic enzyme, partial [bacterium]|nr:NADP-dependent malic enzyme [bacterium]
MKALEPTFGGINLEDISAPDCFYIEEELKKQLKIPVFHDDQHGTAIISSAALINAVELTGKKMAEIKVVYNGAGAAGIACCQLHFALGVKPENIVMCDSQGVIYKGREKGMNPYKEKLAIDTNLRTLAEVMVGADVFVGVSVKDALLATGRSDFPNQVNNVLGFPFIFRGALDCQATEINQEMKLA